MSLTNVLKVISPNGTTILGFSPRSVGAAGTTSITTGLFEKLWFYIMRRNANVTPAVMSHDLGSAPGFHHLLDPNSATSLFELMYENMIANTVAIGPVRTFAGFIAYLSATDSATLMGVGFYADSSDNLWHAFVRDCPTGAAPVTSRHDVTTAILQTGAHRLRIHLNGRTKTITWTIDGITVSTFTPATPLDRMGAAATLFGPAIQVGAFVPASGDVTVRTYAGSPAMLQLRVDTLI